MTRRSHMTTPAAPDAPDADAPPMPDLPPMLTLSTEQQFKAIADPVRSRILGIIQTRPATSKQIATRLGKSPGTVGHHLDVLEAAGLAQVVATRLVHGITAKYYTRTARVFTLNFPSDVTGSHPAALDIARSALRELAESLAAYGQRADDLCRTSFPHIRVSPERARVYEERLTALLADLLAEPVDSNGHVYGISMAMFLAPPYLQDAPPETES